jgi:hypothetical protein
METLLEQGIIPFEFDYTLENNYNNGKIDWTALIYDDWNTLAFWLNKFPNGLLEQYPEMIDFAEDYAKSRYGITPLMELEERKKNKKNN